MTIYNLSINSVPTVVDTDDRTVRFDAPILDKKAFMKDAMNVWSGELTKYHFPVMLDANQDVKLSDDWQLSADQNLQFLGLE